MIPDAVPTHLIERVTLASSVVLFLAMASWAMSPSECSGAPARNAFEAGPLTVEATLSQGTVLRGDEGSLLVHMRLRGAQARSALPIDLALVLDVNTEAKDGASLALMSRACIEVSRELGAADRITVVSFADEARTVLAPGQELQPLVAGTGRDFSAALELAAAELRRSARPGAMRRILFVTSGTPDRGVTDGERLRAQVQRLAAEGVSLSTLGLGPAFDPVLLKALSDAGGGSYHQVDDPERLAGIYAAELRALRSLVARDVRVTLTPAPGVELEEVVEWTTRREAKGTSVLVGDFEGLRSAKVVARVRVKRAVAAADVLTVSLAATDPTTRRELAGPPARLGVRVSADASEVLASTAHGIERDLEDARVVSWLRRAEDCAARRDAAGIREALAPLRRLRPVLEYRAADGRVEQRSVDDLESELVWFATQKEEPGVLASVVETAKETVSKLLPVQARKHGNEASAIGALKTIATSEAMFREGDKEQDGNLDYGSLAELNDMKLIDSVLGGGTKQGYVFEVHPSATTPEFLWYATARPTTPGTTGDRFFYTNQAGVIFYSTQPFEVDPATGSVKKERWDRRAQKFVESYVIPTGK